MFVSLAVCQPLSLCLSLVPPLLLPTSVSSQIFFFPFFLCLRAWLSFSLLLSPSLHLSFWYLAVFSFLLLLLLISNLARTSCWVLTEPKLQSCKIKFLSSSFLYSPPSIFLSPSFSLPLALSFSLPPLSVSVSPTLPLSPSLSFPLSVHLTLPDLNLTHPPPLSLGVGWQLVEEEGGGLSSCDSL